MTRNKRPQGPLFRVTCAPVLLPDMFLFKPQGRASLLADRARAGGGEAATDLKRLGGGLLFLSSCPHLFALINIQFILGQFRHVGIWNFSLCESFLFDPRKYSSPVKHVRPRVLSTALKQLHWRASLGEHARPAPAGGRFSKSISRYVSCHRKS